MARITAPESYTRENIRKFFDDLGEQGLLFHPEDDPGEIVDKHGCEVFTQRECQDLDKIIDCIYNAGFDPCEIALETLKAIEDGDIKS